jgi:hypothetical protein
MEYLKWISENPILTFILAWMLLNAIGNTVIYTARAIRGEPSRKDDDIDV